MSEVFLPKKAKKHEFKTEEIILKDGYKVKPFFVNYDCTIILETFNQYSRQAIDFLIAVAEPITRPRQIHEYKITPYSLYAAVSVGLSTEDIIQTLDSFSKNYIPKGVINFIKECTLSYGKVRLVIKGGKYLIETEKEAIYNFLKNDSFIKQHIINQKSEEPVEEELRSYRLEIQGEQIEAVKKRCIENDYPLIEEYDFKNDSSKDLDMNLRDTVQIRTYQEVSLNKMFGNSRARSGIIVLPCGSGKTLVGITAVCTIKKSCVILCSSAVSVEQWKQQIMLFTTIKENICRFTSDKKEMFDGEGILITTYTMLAFSGKRSFEAKKVMDWLTQREWGLLILDEVHVVPALMFRKVIGLINHRCKLGLTATLVREDDKIEDLNFLIGPKLYEADWQDLSAQGHIANVECVEIIAEMTAEFYKEYLLQPRRRRLLSIMNPTKFQICEFLIKKHESLGEKIIVFSDNVLALKTYALKLNKPFIYGPTSQTERMTILKQFQCNPNINTIFLSKVGDTSIDLPEASCLIQISSHFGSRRQEAQRLGRVLRAKKRHDPGFKVFFYSLVSADTEEIFYSNKRQQFLIDQGYSFRTILSVDGFDKSGNKIFSTKGEQKELLASILLASENDLLSEESDDKDRVEVVKTNLAKKSGAEGMAYMERNKERHVLFRKTEKKKK